MESEVDAAATLVAARKRFIAELRSGKYRQTTKTFISPRDKDCLCAMGVAAVSCGVERGKDDSNEWEFKGMICDVVNRELGITTSIFKSLVSMNDFERLTFGEIAARLEVMWNLK